ncbi:hypothetical protein [Rhizobium sp. RM]|uniref:hypothetical protein n=1 Tax=Rhizobium sp. RM TaxID=2748079 RepID=UPI00110DC0C2|nr:hypothetical protein [Rhizobium sp. RM]NWJ25449.1 hypothetical protein [Rhizobium sp. RM]TMV22081.1 hypothetical protein BJG94_03680 [Rhizobium sp. Td3]
MTNSTVMWEVMAAPGRVKDLVGWLRDDTRDQIPQVERRIFVSKDDRVVAITSCSHAELMPALNPPNELILRAPHQWQFEEISG